MADSIHVSILSPEGKKLDKMAAYVYIPAEDGPIGVLPGHMPMLCSVKAGVVKCRFGNDEELNMRVRDGIAGLENNRLVFLVSHAEEI